MIDHDEEEDPDDWDVDDDLGEIEDGDSITITCPSCGADLYEDADRCPACGDYVTYSTNPWTGKPTWWILLGLAGIGAVLWVFTR